MISNLLDIKFGGYFLAVMALDTISPPAFFI